MTRPDIESRIVWMFGSPRSGSTWLLQMLGAHPAVLPVNEPLLGMLLSPFLANELGYRSEDLDIDTFTIRRAMGEDRNRFFNEEFSDVWLPALGRMINERFDAHLTRYSTSTPEERLIVLKEPNGSQSADIIMRSQPEARLLFLLRDGRDVVDSGLDSMVPQGWGPHVVKHMRGVGDGERLDYVTRFSHQWLWQTETVELAYAAHTGPKHMLRYEDLLSDTRRVVAELLNWLELELATDQLATLIERFEFEKIPQRGPHRFYRSATPGAWRKNLRADEQEAVERILTPKLRELGYV